MNEASARQIAAAHPQRSTWLSANAGSGKTKVLTDRVARLLLRQTPPQNILCLTYTKAAAAEMQNRLLDNLGRWAMLPDDDLRTELFKLDPDVTLSDETLLAARRLFASAVETPGGLKIQTIHSFCSGLLRRFPLEAGVSPQFQELDDRTTGRLIEDILDEIADGPEADMIDAIAPELGKDSIVGFVTKLFSHAEEFETIPEESEIFSWFDLPETTTEESLVSQVFLGGESELLREMAALFLTSDKSTDVKLSAKFEALSTIPPSLDAILTFADAFLVGSESSPNYRLSRFGRPQGIATKGFRIANADALAPLEQLMLRVEEIYPKALAYMDARRTAAIYRFAHRVVTRYKKVKRDLGYLDFDDMIRTTRDLLSRSEMAQWVLFRLDGGLDHILVDEAQDTSPTQWEVIRHLAEEFASGSGARDDIVRTIFVVGDKKQSIYSFQGADPTGFDRMQEYFDERLKPTGNELQKLVLEHSFRSSSAILKAVDAVFEATEGKGVGGVPNHIAFFGNRAGRVDVWPMVYSEDDANSDSDWKDPVDRVSPRNHQVLLADEITKQIADMLESGSIQAKDGSFRAIEPRDIMILVKSRTSIFPHILSKLKSAGLPVAGADRLIISDELGVRDLLSLLSFLALEDDDLSLAEALRSPIFNLSEQDLFNLAHARGGETLWRRIYKQKDTYPETFAILSDLRNRIDFLRPYELLDRILTRHGARRRMIARLGAEAEDAIDQLLVRARTYETAEVPSLTGFLAWFEEQKSEVKRQIGESANLIRVLTTHGAKGLEAPIVILPECARAPRTGDGETMVRLPSGQLVINSAKAVASDAVCAASELAVEAALEEDRRLLYVAMTRAEQWLIVAGSQASEPKSANKIPTWYDLVCAGFETLETTNISTPIGNVRRFSVGDWHDGAIRKSVQKEAPLPAFPSWAEETAPKTPAKAPFLAPSQFKGAKAIQGSIDDTSDLDVLRYGRQVHALLDILPEIPASERRDYALLALEETEDAIREGEVDGLLEETARVMDGEYDWEIFGPNALSEVPFAGVLEIGGEAVGVNGIIDRMIIEPERIRIVDFKTNKVVPQTVEEVPDGLLQQLAAYEQAASRMYPDRLVEVALLWTKTAELMPIPLDIVRRPLDRAAIS